ncbi:MAG: M20 family metallopeptidase [Desulfobacterales bacterium]|nr:MAG: M20 family metallopeptidase [Desulfobacterales bacterium]
MKAVIDLTKDLIRFESTHSKPQEIKRCFEFIKNQLKNNGIEYKWIHHHRYPSLLVLPANGFAPVLLMTHIDVVDAPSHLFNPYEKAGKLYGRGSYDDKYAVALSLILLKNHLHNLRTQGKDQSDLPFGILITSDEEIGGFDGAKKLLQEIPTAFCIALDGGCIEKMVVKEKGLVKLRLVSKVETVGKSPLWPGANAVEKLIDDFIKIRNYCVRSVPEHPHRAVNICRMRSGKPRNRVPDYAEAWIDIRYTENDNMERLVEILKNELHSEVSIESIEPRFDEGPSSHLRLLLEIAANTSIGFEDDSNDARFFSTYGIRGVVWGADGDRSQHTLDEHVNIESINTLYNMLSEFLEKGQHLTKT